eukprot:CAMPEP_0182495674 /NCGR_PEP_ID=MMETSP1321-20130603/4436_1 /TAXON_ID=91990 /ORGANISM="Bolidomonas sp., Strain RCC1657" /LENGTH=148 /DNA_ID=CAMNT_0024699115 /DNA_START=1242 /DNA_END=1685 /DNA_ORIENTATION=+
MEIIRAKQFAVRQDEISMDEAGRELKNAVDEWTFVLVALEKIGEATTRRQDLLDGLSYLRSRVIMALRNDLFEAEKGYEAFSNDDFNAVLSKEEFEKVFIVDLKKKVEEHDLILSTINKEFEKLIGLKAEGPCTIAELAIADNLVWIS